MHYHLTDCVGCMKQLLHLTGNRPELKRFMDDEQNNSSLEEIWEVLAVDLKRVSKLLTLSQSTLSLDQAAGVNILKICSRFLGLYEYTIYGITNSLFGIVTNRNNGDFHGFNTFRDCNAGI